MFTKHVPNPEESCATSLSQSTLTSFHAEEASGMKEDGHFAANNAVTIEVYLVSGQILCACVECFLATLFCTFVELSPICY